MLNSAVHYPEVVSKNVGTVSVGEDGRSIYYNELLLDNMRMFPLGLMPREKAAIVLSHHLSYPAGNSINDL